MKVKGSFSMGEPYTSDKDVTYFQATDLEAGGTFSFTLDGGGSLPGVKAGTVLLIDGDMRITRTPKGTFVTLVEGAKIQIAKVTFS